MNYQIAVNMFAKMFAKIPEIKKQVKPDIKS